MAQDYSLSEAQKHLKTDNKTLTRWMSLAGIHPRADPRNQSKKLLTRTQLEHLAHLHGRTLPPDTPARTADPLAALEQKLRRHYDTQLAALEARIKALETQAAAPAPQTPSQPRQPATPAQPGLPPQPARPTPPAAPERVRVAQPDLESRYQAIGFLTQHGASYSVVNGWRVLPPMRADALRYALERGQRLRMCGEEGCVCRDVLD